MKAILLILLLLIPCSAFTWNNPNQSAVSVIGIAADKPGKIRLENRRVQTINNDTFTYNTGRKILTIKADSLAARQFIQDVKSGRTSARASVTLIPQRRSPFNTEYKAR